MSNKYQTYKENVEHREPPINLNPKDKNLFQHEFSKNIDESYVKVEKNVYVSNKNLLNTKKFTFYIRDTFMNFPPLKNIIKPLINFFVYKYNKEFNKDIETGVWVINNKSENYFHWMTEVLTRVLSFSKTGKKSTILLPKNFEKLEYVPKTLELMKVAYNFYENDTFHKVNELHLTNHTAPAGNYNSLIINDLHNKLGNQNSDLPKKRLWVSRKYSNRRFLLNEDGIENLLHKYNIEIFYPEKYSYSDQIEHYRNSEFIGGVVGAALANMLYMKKNSSVLELRAKNDDLNNCHYSLACSLGNSFYYLICENDDQDNSIVNPEDLEEVFKVIFKD